jgi:nucleoside-triphosphatase THEP1
MSNKINITISGTAGSGKSIIYGYIKDVLLSKGLDVESNFKEEYNSHTSKIIFNKNVQYIINLNIVQLR